MAQRLTSEKRPLTPSAPHSGAGRARPPRRFSRVLFALCFAPFTLIAAVLLTFITLDFIHFKNDDILACVIFAAAVGGIGVPLLLYRLTR